MRHGCTNILISSQLPHRYDTRYDQSAVAKCILCLRDDIRIYSHLISDFNPIRVLSPSQVMECLCFHFNLSDFLLGLFSFHTPYSINTLGILSYIIYFILYNKNHKSKK